MKVFLSIVLQILWLLRLIFYDYTAEFMLEVCLVFEAIDSSAHITAATVIKILRISWNPALLLEQSWECQQVVAVVVSCLVWTNSTWCWNLEADVEFEQAPEFNHSLVNYRILLLQPNLMFILNNIFLYYYKTLNNWPWFEFDSN